MAAISIYIKNYNPFHIRWDFLESNNADCAKGTDAAF